MRATRFSVGFGPALLSRTHGDTEYRLAALPLGGYVRIVGMARPRPGDLAAVGEAVEEAQRRRPADRPDRLGPAYRRLTAALNAGEDASLKPLADELQAALEADSDLIDPERLAWCRRETTRVRDDVDPNCYWRADVWRRIVVIARGAVRQRARRRRDPDRLLLVRAPAVQRHDEGRPGRAREPGEAERACGPATSSCA